jgi:protein SCO1/2
MIRSLVPSRGARARALGALALLVPALAQALPMGEALQKPLPPAANPSIPAILKDVKIDEKLGEALPLDARFTAEDGSAVRLGDVVAKGRPTVLALVYFNCPMLCGLVLTGISRAMRETGLTLGKDFNALTISFDPADTPAVAAERQHGYLQAFGQPGAKRAWHFLTGAQPDITAVADAVGFRYAYDARTKQFAHPAAIFVITGDGHVSRYFYGVEFPPHDLRLALVEAGQGRVGTSFDRLLLTCYRYDPASRAYTPYALGFLRIAMAGVLVGLGVVLGIFWRREWKRRGAGPGGKAP